MSDTDETVTEDTGSEESIEETSEETSGSDDSASAAPDTEAQTEARQTRKERRANVLAEAKREAAEFRTSLETERRERQAMAEQLAEMRGRMAAQADAGPKPEDQEKAKLKELRTEMENEMRLCAEGKTTMDRYWALDEERQELIAGRRAKREYEEQRKNAPDPRREASKATLEAEYPWLSTNVQARQTADGYINILAAKGMDPQAMSTWKAACALAAKDWKLGGSAGEPDATRRSRYAGTTGNEAAGAAGGNGSTKLSADDMKIAEARYSDLSPEQAHAKWRKKVQSKLNAGA